MTLCYDLAKIQSYKHSGESYSQQKLLRHTKNNCTFQPKAGPRHFCGSSCSTPCSGVRASREDDGGTGVCSPAWHRQIPLHTPKSAAVLGGTARFVPAQAVMPGWRFRFQILLTRNAAAAAVAGNSSRGGWREREIEIVFTFRKPSLQWKAPKS